MKKIFLFIIASIIFTGCSSTVDFNTLEKKNEIFIKKIKKHHIVEKHLLILKMEK